MSEEAKKSSLLDKANFVVTVLVFIGIPTVGLVLSLELSNLRQGFQLMLDGEETKWASTYVDKPAFSAAVGDINAHIGRQEQHIDVVDQRENTDREAANLKIQQLQDRGARGGLIRPAGGASAAEVARAQPAGETNADGE